jgi:hypothetical protein
MTEQVTSEEFAVGEIAVLIYSRYGRTDGPVDCLVVGSLIPRLNTTTELPETGYAVEVAGVVYLALPEQLRKKRPPRDDLKVTRWDQCPWQPESINV